MKRLLTLTLALGLTLLSTTIFAEVRSITVSLDRASQVYSCSLDGNERKIQYDEYHASLASGLRYCYDGAPDRDKYFFRNAYLGIDRAIDYVLSRDDIDPTRVGYQGVSQGGASAFRRFSITFSRRALSRDFTTATRVGSSMRARRLTDTPWAPRRRCTAASRRATTWAGCFPV